MPIHLSRILVYVLGLFFAGVIWAPLRAESPVLETDELPGRTKTELRRLADSLLRLQRDTWPQKLKVSVELEYQSFHWDNMDPAEQIADIDDATMPLISDLGDAVKSLKLFHTRVTDNGIEHLRGMKIERLCIDVAKADHERGVWEFEGGQISDKTLEIVQTLPRLKHLSLRGSQITDEGLERFCAHFAAHDRGSVPPLEYLDISETPVSGSSLKMLIVFPLRELRLQRMANFEPENLRDLASIESLRVLDISHNAAGEIWSGRDLTFLAELQQVELIRINATPARFRQRNGQRLEYYDQRDYRAMPNVER